MKVYLPSDADLQAYENKMQAYYRENMFEDDFEWGTDYNTVTGVDVGGTTNNNISYVWKAGSALPTSSFGVSKSGIHGPSYYYNFRGANSGSSTTSSTDVKTISKVTAEIINDDEEHGQVFHFKATDTLGSRGPFFRTGKVFTDRFVAVEYEAKFTDTTTGISNYVNPNKTSVSGSWQNTVNNNNHSVKTYLNTKAGYSDTASTEIYYKGYLPTRAGYFEDGKLVGWHKITYLFDNTRDTYDFYVDDVLIATDISKLDRDSGKVAGLISGMMMGQPSGNAEMYIDNFKVYGMTDSQAADKTLAGFDNLFGTGVIPYHDSRLSNSFKSLSLPEQPFAGKNAIYQGIYKILDSEGNVISENRENKAVKYTFNTGASSGISEFVDTIFSYKLKPGVKLADGETLMTAENFDFDIAYKYEDGKLSNMDDTYKSLGSAYMTMNGDVGGWTTDKYANITVSIEKGVETRTKTYNIVFQKDLASPQLYSGMEYGKPVFNNRITSNQAYTTLYVAGRNVTDENLTYLAFIVFEKADGTIYKTAMTSIDIAAGVDKTLNHSYEWKEEDITAMQGGKIKAFAWVNAKDGTYIPLTVINPITTIPTSTSEL